MMPTARDIAGHLLTKIVGQDEAVRALSVAAAQHYARIQYEGDVLLKKANVLIVGPTGVGKTALCRALAEYLDVPFASVTASAITQPGFTGMDPDAVLGMLLQKAGKNGRERAQVGIAFIDEIDKIARKDTDEGEKARNLTTGLGVQQALLDVLDANVWHFAEGPYKGQSFDASKVLFICSGAFVGIERIVAYRMRRGMRTASPIPVSQGEAMRNLEPADVIAYGMIPELVGRLPVLVPLRPLDPHELVRIMTVPMDAPIRRLVAEFASVGVTLVMNDVWLQRVAADASAKGTGARAIESVVRPALSAAFYLAEPGDRVTVTADGGFSIEKAAPSVPHSPVSSEAKLTERAEGSVSETVGG